MKKKLLSILALAMGLGFSNVALADGWEWGPSAYAAASAGGYAGTAMDGWESGVYSNQHANVATHADTDPNYAAALASLEQSTGGYAEGYEVWGDLYMEGSTSTYAHVGRRGTGASTYTAGWAGMYGSINGHGSVVGELSGSSDQASVSLDTGRGGYSDAAAEQTTAGSVSASAHDDDYASSSVGVSATGYAEANN